MFTWPVHCKHHTHIGSIRIWIICRFSCSFLLDSNRQIFTDVNSIYLRNHYKHCYNIFIYLKLTIRPCFPVPTMLPIVLLTLVPYMLQQASSSSVQPSAVTFDNRTDGDTLLAFKARLSNQQGALASWNSTTDFCQWQGVSCSVKH